MTCNGLSKMAFWRFWVAGLAALLLSACGGGSSSPSGTSALSFQIAWDRSAGGSNFQRASLSDCYDMETGHMVATVTAEIYDMNGELLASGAWGCMEGSGLISGLAANQSVTVAVAGHEDPEGPNPGILYFGQKEVFLTPGTVDAGTIEAGRFMPAMVAPANDSTIYSYAVDLEWQEVPTAAGYLVKIWDDSIFNREIPIADGRTTSVRLTDLPSGFYTWSVQAIDRAGHPGVSDDFWQFYFDQLQIVEVIFTDLGNPGPEAITTGVYFWAWEGFQIYYEEQNTFLWADQIDESEFSEMRQIILENDLMEQPDIVLEAGMDPCTGWQGMDITIVMSNESSHVFQINGQVCDRQNWPTPVLDLVMLRDRLVEKYDPSNF